ncbi:MAG: nucleotide sugar dehydrogenase [Myxococcales bacterium]|nr:nucleotide sugar dehydrogenase [Myxococcales bacterium]
MNVSLSDSNEFDVCIVGTGRVGLPLGLSMLETGLRVTGLDVDPAIRASVNQGIMPFAEPGYDELIARRSFQVSGDPAVIQSAASIVITVGTPLHTHIETDLDQIRRVLESIGPHLRTGHLVCLRSTVAPGTTQFVEKWIERNTALKVGDSLSLAFCPERIAEGKAYEELRSLTQIIGTHDQTSAERAERLFSGLAPDVMHTDYVSAELVKLFNNIARYVHFAVANQFALVADTFGTNIYEIRRMANHNYPRSHIAMPGLTAGTCLRKDFGMINEWSPYPDMLLAAWKMNEFIPTFLVTHLKQRVPVHDRKVAVLGYTFKMDTDDTRDSLVPKLIRYLEREMPSEIRVSDHHLSAEIELSPTRRVENWTAADACRDAHCVFVATNHSGYDDVLNQVALENPDAWIVDIWNVGQADKIFYQAKMLRD